MIAKVNI